MMNRKSAAAVVAAVAAAFTKGIISLVNAAAATAVAQ